MNFKKNKDFFAMTGVQSVVSSLICIVLGLFVGYIVLSLIDFQGAPKAIASIIKGCFWFPKSAMVKKALASTLVKSAPLLMCSLSVLFAYKTGLFNIGVCGQYTFGAAVSIWLGLKFNLNWSLCVLAAFAGGAFLGSISGFLKAKFNVNEVISCIMLNWISLYTANSILFSVKEPTTPYTLSFFSKARNALIPSLGMGKFFGNNKYITIAIPLSVIMAVLVWILLDKTKFGFELRATGLSKDAAKYAGMKEVKNVICTMAIAGGLAGMGAAFFFLCGIEQWSTSSANLPSMGFNGLSAAFLGGLHPIGVIFSSLFIQHITDGGALVDKSVYSPQIADFISSIIIYLCGFVIFIKYIMNRIISKKRG